MKTLQIKPKINNADFIQSLSKEAVLIIRDLETDILILKKNFLIKAAKLKNQSLIMGDYLAFKKELAKLINEKMRLFEKELKKNKKMVANITKKHILNILGAKNANKTN